MSWAIGLWIAYGVFTIAIFGLAFWGLNYAQKVLLGGSSKEDE